MLTMPEIIAHSSSLSVLAPLVLYIIKVRKADKPVHIIGALLFVAASCDLAGYLLYKSGKSTAVVFNVYYTLMFFLLCWFYHEIFFKKKITIAILFGVSSYILSFVLITFYIQNFMNYQNLIWMIAGIILIVYSITYFLYSIAAIPSTHIFNNTLTWFNTGILFYFSLSIFLFSMGDYLFNKQDSQVTLLLWSTHNVNNVIKNILFTIGLTMTGKRTSINIQPTIVDKSYSEQLN
jgi:hypothetical protein